MFSVAMLHALRAAELAAAARDIPAGSSILEIGGGTGFQAKLLSEAGHRVESLDIAASDYRDDRVFPVRDFDGRHLPFPDASFDIVFSSNVLEHVVDLPPLIAEMKRVLKRDGRCIHMLPSASWRFWTSLAHYPALPWLVLSRVTGERKSGGEGAPRSRWRLLSRLVWAGRHGEHGSAASELYLFSRHRWRALFRRHGFAVIESRPVGIFCTGHMLLGRRLSFAFRRRLARCFGSASDLYVLRLDDRAG